MVIEITLNELLEAGCHFGHQARRWHPRMRPYLYAKREGIHIFDLVKTKEGLEESCQYMYEAAAQGKRICMVATKRQAQAFIRDSAKQAGVAYMTERWLGGTLTNYDQIKSRMNRLTELKQQRDTGQLKKLTKKEQLLIDREINKLERFLGGLMIYDDKPEVLFVVDTRREKVAIEEANKAGVTVVGIVDSNADPSGVDYVIPANDDAVKSVQLIVNKISEAIVEGKHQYAKKAEKLAQEAATKKASDTAKQKAEAKKEDKEKQAKLEKAEKAEAERRAKKSIK